MAKRILNDQPQNEAEWNVVKEQHMLDYGTAYDSVNASRFTKGAALRHAFTSGKVYELRHAAMTQAQ